MPPFFAQALQLAALVRRLGRQAARRLLPLLPLLLAAFATGFMGQTAHAGPPVHEEAFRRIGGIEQWVTVHGEDREQPLLLFLHGGPGNPLSPFATAMYGAWSRDFVLVQWDQRGAGQTFARRPEQEAEALSIERMAEDGLELAAQLKQEFGGRPLILIASSWGSALGVHMVQRQPKLYAAYIGTAQLVSGRANLQASYQQTLARVDAAGDTATAAALRALGPPPHQDPRAFGVLRRAIRKLEAQTCTPAPRHWWQPEAPYQEARAQAALEAGEDYSFLQFVGLAGDGMLSTLDLHRLGRVYRLPLHFIQGEQDLLTTPDVTEAWVNTLSAPEKTLTRVPRAGHDPNPELLQAQWQRLLLIKAGLKH